MTTGPRTTTGAMNTGDEYRSVSGFGAPQLNESTGSIVGATADREPSLGRKFAPPPECKYQRAAISRR